MQSKFRNLWPAVIFAILLMGTFIYSRVLGHSVSQPNTSNLPQQNSDLQITRSLTDEVRLLRLSIERSQTNVVIAQGILERIRIQQEQVNFISQRLDNVRNEIVSSQANLPKLSQNILDAENRIKSEEDDKAKATLQREYKEAQVIYEQQKILEGQQKALADNLAYQLQIEQGKLDKLNEQFDKMEQEMKSQQLQSKQSSDKVNR